ncbi:MAG: 30S ribosomal protein S13 [Candidatus Gracilibacteria bacterium]
MVRILGVNIPNHKHLWVALTSIYGVGVTRSRALLAAVKIDASRKVETLSEEELGVIRDELKKHTLEGDLRREIMTNIKTLQDMNCYRGVRHKKGLPVRGQRTKTNARTKRGKKNTVANKKVAA